MRVYGAAPHESLVYMQQRRSVYFQPGSRQHVALYGRVLQIFRLHLGGALHLYKVPGAVRVALENIAPHQHVVENKSGLVNEPGAFFYQLGGALHGLPDMFEVRVHQPAAGEIFPAQHPYGVSLVENMLLLRADRRHEAAAVIVKPEPFKALPPHHELRFRDALAEHKNSPYINSIPHQPDSVVSGWFLDNCSIPAGLCRETLSMQPEKKNPLPVCQELKKDPGKTAGVLRNPVPLPPGYHATSTAVPFAR